MSDRFSGAGAGQGGSKEYFTNGRGPGRGMDIGEHRGPPKEKSRGVGNGDPILIDLDNLERPGIGPMNYVRPNGFKAPQKGEEAPGAETAT